MFYITGPELHRRLVVLNSCPIQQARWCVISYYEMMKCENMIMAFSAKNIKPDLNCVMGLNVQDCLQKISTGDADLITLDAADVYQAGKSVFIVYFCCCLIAEFYFSMLTPFHPQYYD